MVSVNLWPMLSKYIILIRKWEKWIKIGGKLLKLSKSKTLCNGD